MRKIPVGYDGKEVIWTLIDDDIFDLIGGYSWRVKYNSRSGKLESVVRTSRRESFYMHHSVIGKPSFGYVVDHINRNPLDNRRENLRFVSFRENRLNSVDCTGGGGVRKDGKRYYIHLSFTTKEAAEAALESHRNSSEYLYEE